MIHIILKLQQAKVIKWLLNWTVWIYAIYALLFSTCSHETIYEACIILAEV